MEAAKRNPRRKVDDVEEPEKPLPKRSKGSRAQPKTLSPVVYKAAIKELAGAKSSRTGPSMTDCDDAMMLRIKKCLDRGNHPNTPEAEAKAALRMASRLMGDYNVTQAEVLAHEPPEKQSQYAGQSTVSVTRCDGDRGKTVRYQSFTVTLLLAICEFFDCKTYTLSRKEELTLTFYGIAQNTIAAAMSFVMAYNLISEWARPYKGIASKNSYCHADEELRAKKARSNTTATKTKEKEAGRAKSPNSDSSTPEPEPRQEDKAQESSEATNTTTQGCAKTGYGPSSPGKAEKPEKAEKSDKFKKPEKAGVYRSDSDDSDESGFHPIDEDDLLEEMIEAGELEYINEMPPPEEWFRKDRKKTKTQAPKLKTSPPPTARGKSPLPESGEDTEPRESKWASHGQLIMFRETATKIADDYLKSTGMKLGRSKTRNMTVRDDGAYNQGKADSKKIDVRRKGIGN
ncbi:ankyrin repeat protein [Apiospora marii]|uniref:ankyrin repeat protein n=1 Tax=Apiospora marii TaxID=335849 RepID=UPI00312ED8C6